LWNESYLEEEKTAIILMEFVETSSETNNPQREDWKMYFEPHAATFVNMKTT